jgi:1,2-diacylglycerol 3-alpha-glucosyltransferase
MRKMKIGFFTDTFAPTRNGVVTSIESFGGELVGRGHDVHVFCPRSDREQHLGMQVHSYPSVRFPPYPEYKVGFPVRGVPELDIVHTHGPFTFGWFGLWIARRQGIPKISTYHTIMSDYVQYISRVGKRALGKLADNYCAVHYNKYDTVVTPSHALRKTLRRVHSPIEVIPTGIDTSFFRRIDLNRARRKLGIEAEKVFVYVGRLSREKHVDFVIRAAKDFLDDDSGLWIVGQGPEKARLERLAASLRLGKQVHFTGFVQDELLPYYYTAADAFITASTCETQGIVLAEAMACGCPVIGADYLAIPETIKDGKNGLLFKPGNHNQLVDIASNFRSSKKMRCAARKTGESLSVEKCTDMAEDLYEGLGL